MPKEEKPAEPEKPVSVQPKGPDKGCVFKTVFGEEPSDNNYVFKTPEKVRSSIEDALEWIAKAQSESGGWGSRNTLESGVMDPHAVHTDPATTAMVAMSILRCGSTLNSGPYSKELKRALEYLLKQVEASSQNSLNITDETGTQPQIKLGQNIDVVLTSQFLTNVLDELEQDKSLKTEWFVVINCVFQNSEGSNSKW